MGRKRKCIPETVESMPEVPVVQRNSANARERNRMRVLSKAFVKLKTTLPWVPPDTKLSKLDTLRLATCYIAHLRQILAEDSEENNAENNEQGSFSHPLNLTWPFSFASIGSKSLDGSPVRSPDYRAGRDLTGGAAYPLQQQQQQQQQSQRRMTSS